MHTLGCGSEADHVRPRITLLITDLDNTLWDWFGAWHASFSAMLQRLCQLSGVPEEQLIGEMRTVHRRRGTTEYSCLLNELPSLQVPGSRIPPLEMYDDAMHAMNRERIRHTSLYEGVLETLIELKGHGIPVVAYTDSVAYWSEWRIRKTELDGLIHTLYSSPDHDLPSGTTLNDLRKFGPGEYGLSGTTHQKINGDIKKPDPAGLNSILSDFSVRPDRVVYVGDSLMKDVAMAKEVGVHDVHAQYGAAQTHPGYDLLRRVSHWTESDIAREQALSSAPDVAASYSLTRFSGLLELFDFGGSL